MDYIADYAPYEIKDMKNNRASIEVSNHGSFLDHFVLLASPEIKSFLATYDTINLPLIGPVCTDLQSIYIKRSDELQKDRVLKLVEERVNDTKENKSNYPPLVIYPEGACGNGQWLLSFKKSAFCYEGLLKITSLEYKSPCEATWCLTSLLQHIVLLICNPQLGLVIHEFDIFNPQYTIDKNNLKPKGDNNWTYIAKDVQYLMEYGCGLKNSEDTFRERKQFERGLNLIF